MSETMERAMIVGKVVWIDDLPPRDGEDIDNYSIRSDSYMGRLQDYLASNGGYQSFGPAMGARPGSIIEFAEDSADQAILHRVNCAINHATGKRLPQQSASPILRGIRDGNLRRLEAATIGLIEFATNDPTRYESRNPYSRPAVLQGIEAVNRSRTGNNAAVLTVSPAPEEDTAPYAVPGEAGLWSTQANFCKQAGLLLDQLAIIGTGMVTGRITEDTRSARVTIMGGLQSAGYRIWSKDNGGYKVTPPGAMPRGTYRTEPTEYIKDRYIKHPRYGVLIGGTNDGWNFDKGGSK